MDTIRPCLIRTLAILGLLVCGKTMGNEFKDVLGTVDTTLDFKFTYKIPEFNQKDRELINKGLPIIIEKLENPNNYFVYLVQEEENKVILHLLPLGALQLGVNMVNKKGVVAFDPSVIFVFDKKMNFKYIRNEPLNK